MTTPLNPVDDLLLDAAVSAPEATEAAALRYLAKRRVAAWRRAPADGVWVLCKLLDHGQDWMCRVEGSGTRWRWSVHNGGDGDANSLAEACEACHRHPLLAGWMILAVPPAPVDRAAARKAARERLLTPITDEEYRRRQEVGETLTDEELQQVADMIRNGPRCARCRDSGRVSLGNLWGPFEDCPRCRGPETPAEPQGPTPCPDCEGAGVNDDYFESLCGICGGSGVAP